MADCQVTCIVKPNRDSEHEHITHLGGKGWLWKVESVINSIEQNTNTFYVLDPVNQKRSDVGVVRPDNGRPHVRTHADGRWNNNLLSLEQCPL